MCNSWRRLNASQKLGLFIKKLKLPGDVTQAGLIFSEILHVFSLKIPLSKCNSFFNFCELVYLKKSEKKAWFPHVLKSQVFLFFFIYINTTKQTKEMFIHTLSGTDKVNTCAQFLRMINATWVGTTKFFFFVIRQKAWFVQIYGHL